jgi:glyoxylate reductase
MSGARPTVLIARQLPENGRARIAERCELREGGLQAGSNLLRELADGVNAIVSDPTVTVGPELLDAAGPTLRLVANFAVGYDNIDLDACRERGVFVTHTPDVLTNATAELALALTLAAARSSGAAEAWLRDGCWTGFDPSANLGTGLSGASFGIVGMGRIGKRYAELVRPLAGALSYYSRTAKADAEHDLGMARINLDQLLSCSDVISLHLPASEETAGMIGEPELARMRRGSILVNTARGSLLDSKALARALGEGEIGAAGLDVYEREPEVPTELLEAPNCVLLPHIGSATVSAREGMATLVANAVLAVLDGREPEHLIDRLAPVRTTDLPIRRNPA